MAGREHALQMQRGQQPPASVRMTSISLKTDAPEGQTSQPVIQLSDLNFDYFCTIPGRVKMSQLVLGAICLGCGSPALFGFAKFYMFVAGITFICTGFLSLARLFKISLNVPNVEWSLAECIYTSFACLLWLVASAVELALGSNRSLRTPNFLVNLSDQYIAAGVFGLFQVIVYGTGAFFLLIEWKATRPAPPPTSIPQS